MHLHKRSRRTSRSSALATPLRRGDAAPRAPTTASGPPFRPRGPSLKGSISNLSLIFQPNEQTLQGSFSSVSTPNFASKYSLESSWRDLQDLIRFTCFCTAQTSIFQKIFAKLFRIFGKICKHSFFKILFTDFCSDFDEILSPII